MLFKELIDQNFKVDEFVKINKWIEMDDVQVLIIGITVEGTERKFWSMIEGNFPEELRRQPDRRKSMREQLKHQIMSAKNFEQRNINSVYFDDGDIVMRHVRSNFLDGLSVENLKMIQYFHSQGIDFKPFYEMDLKKVFLSVGELRQDVELKGLSKIKIEMDGRRNHYLIDHSFTVDFSVKDVQTLTFTNPHTGEADIIHYKAGVMDLKEEMKNRPKQLEEIMGILDNQTHMAFLELKYDHFLEVYTEEYLSGSRQMNSVHSFGFLRGNNVDGFHIKNLKTVEPGFEGKMEVNIFAMHHSEPRITEEFDLSL